MSDQERAKKFIDEQVEIINDSKSCKEQDNRLIVHAADAFAAIREECAKVADGHKLVKVHIGPLYNYGWDECSKAIAAAIRAGGGT